MKSSGTLSPERLLGLGTTAVLLGIVVAPLARLAQQALTPSGGAPTLWHTLSAPVTLNATLNSLVVSAGGTAVAVILGTFYALLLGLTDIRARRALVFLLLLPLMIPPQITALSWSQLMGPSSVLLKTLGLAPPPGSPNPIYSAWGIALLLGLQQTPLVFLALRAGVATLPRDLFEAARCAGADSGRRFVDILLPLSMPGILAGAALSFVSCLDNFGIPALLGAPIGYNVLSTLIYQRLSSFGTSVLTQVAQLSLLAAGLALVGLGAQGLLQRRWRRRLNASSPPLRIVLGQRRLPLEALAWGLLGSLLGVPTLALLAASMVSAYGLPLDAHTITLTHYGTLLADAMIRAAVGHSVLLASLAALIAGLIALPIAYLTAWEKSHLTRILAGLSDLPFALPGAIVAVAAILLLLKPLPLLGFSLYGTLWIILYAYLLRFLTLAIKPVVSGLAQADPALNEAARACGAGLGMRLRTIVWPLASPLLLGSAIMIFLMAINELTVSALLWSSGSETLGVMIYNLEDGGSTGAAAALSIATLAGILLLLAALQALARRLPVGSLPWS
ncbi:ABC transporter permease [Acidihalobacter ferrooxydans]|uniref:ABC transmembrane type-1 domain-containing protein n=1 Tax=Acidihalobacter ferrooxydans TaxID=1765967 RepID=A0A1P8UGS4_9GAMM|nr:iron ABC transporter permease [Acidihalobacter ferrooxydans]APZ43046.1 hypothetical protein BW247_08025 [Acidihalobacter ferrooxydans]